MAFKIGSILNSASLSQALDTLKVSYIKRENIFPNPFNSEIYSLENIEILSYSIEDTGLLEPIVVRVLKKSESQEKTTYQIVSGHRRMKAIDALVSRNEKAAADFEFIPCIIRSNSSKESTSDGAMLNKDDFEVDELNEDLIDGNIFNRNKTDAERAKELQVKRKILEKRRRRGDKVPGRMLELIAAELDISIHQAKKLDSINRKAAPSVKDAFEKGELSTDAAYELSRTDKTTQEEIIYSSPEDEPLTAKTVVAKIKSKQEENTSVPKNDSSDETEAVVEPGVVVPDEVSPTENGDTVSSPKNSAPIHTDENLSIYTGQYSKSVNSYIDVINNVVYVKSKLELFKDNVIPAELHSDLMDKLNDIYVYLSKHAKAEQ